MAESWGTPEQVIEREKKQLAETWAAFKQARDGESESERAGYAAAKERYELALEEYKQSRRDYLPLSPAEGIKAPPVARAAYSDRMAWLMANMANMAYIHFDSGYEPDEEERIARQKREIERLKFCLQSGQYGRHKQDDKQPDAGLSFELVKIFDTSEGHRQGTKKTDTQAFLAKSSTFAVLSFRGTELTRWPDIWTDLQAVLRKTRFGEVHTGFREAYEEVKAEIHEWLPKIGDLPLYITGHSMGAALATVATQDLDQDPNYRDQVAACYTFGSPRVGDGVYEGKIKVPFYRMVHATDLVTLVPLFFWTYVHVGDPRYLSRADKGRMLYRGMPVGLRTWEAILEMLNALVHLHNPLNVWVNAHGMTHYIEKLKKIASARNPL